MSILTSNIFQDRQVNILIEIPCRDQHDLIIPNETRRFQINCLITSFAKPGLSIDDDVLPYNLIGASNHN